MVLSVEPLEVMRYWHYLAPDGWVVASVTPYINIPDYPAMETLLEQLVTFGNVVLVDSAQLAKAAGNLRAQNMVVVGAAAPLLGFTDDQLLAHVTSLFKAKGERIVEINHRAFMFGRAAGQFFRGMVEAGIRPLAALKLCQRFEPATIDPAHVGSWVDLLGDEAKNLDRVLAGDEPLVCNRPALA
jgi:indolepyruvate ferredoxin oxidoreductase beta subunit